MHFLFASFRYVDFIHASPADHQLEAASMAFDANMSEIYPILTCGGTIYPIPSEDLRLSPTNLIDFITRSRVSVMFLTTQLAELFLKETFPNDFPLTFLLCGGEKLHFGPPPSVHFALINIYGPTETTVNCTAFVVPSGAVNPPIGQPLPNEHCYILDSNMTIVPVGVYGELFVGGPGISQGYFKRPELTRERFIRDPFSQDLRSRLFATGDICRWLSDGNIEILGRKDTQVCSCPFDHLKCSF